MYDYNFVHVLFCVCHNSVFWNLIPPISSSETISHFIVLEIYSNALECI